MLHFFFLSSPIYRNYTNDRCVLQYATLRSETTNDTLLVTCTPQYRPTRRKHRLLTSPKLIIPWSCLVDQTARRVCAHVTLAKRKAKLIAIVPAHGSDAICARITQAALRTRQELAHAHERQLSANRDKCASSGRDLRRFRPLNHTRMHI